MSIDYWQTRDATSGEYRDVTDADINRIRNRAGQTAKTATSLRMQHSPELDRQVVFVDAFKRSLAVEIALLKA